ncbi:MAG: NAD(P)-binding protein [Marivibrio sp.]|uniref:oxidoreductase n=1 Tax=Marivibrio sp. TaxID=2039719 RepID=UPI0032EF2D8D
MTRDPRYDLLFEPMRIGPVTAKNRFYQVPHCTGSGYLRPHVLAGLRAMKAEGGWGVINTEYCSIHPSSDDTPHPMAALWDAGDVKAHALMTEAVHEHGALAGVELCHGGARMANLTTREVPLGPVSAPNLAGNPYQTRAMDKADIRAVRRWHRDAALRAREAGFDLVYVYATHGYLLSQFLNKELNRRTDEYGGSLENRLRLMREIIEDTKDAVGDRLAVAVRFSVETNGGGGGDGAPVPGETEDVFGLIGEAPDLWDLNVEDYSLEMGLSRFTDEGALEPYIAAVRGLTSKPVVTVGRYTSPDSMVRLVKSGAADFVGAARPSIADPFLPKKIEEGRLEDVRECIGCNICYTGDGKGAPIRCTQNPTMSEEWRLGWHPERLPAAAGDATVLIVGAGPAGLEAAQALGKRGYQVTLAEATRELGGRVAREARLPGLAAWARVRDHRLQQLDQLANVEIYRESPLSAEDVLAVGADHVAVATGARWRRDGFGPSALGGVAGLSAPAARILTPDDLMADEAPTIEGPVLIYDDDHYYMASVLAEKLATAGHDVALATPADRLSDWGAYTVDRWRAQRRLMDLGVTLLTAGALSGFDGERATLACAYTGRESAHAAGALVLVTTRAPVDALYHELAERRATGAAGAPKTLARIGDCDAPAVIAAAVYAGRRFAMDLEAPEPERARNRHDRIFAPSP